METKIVIDARLHVTGIKKRCRKVNRHSFDLGEFKAPVTDETREVILALANNEVKRVMKTWQDHASVGLPNCRG